MKPAKPRATASMKLAVMLAKQAAFNNKIAALKRAVTEAAEADVTASKLKFGKLAQEFGILKLSDSVLRKAFAEIAKFNNCTVVPAIPASEVKTPAALEQVKPAEPVLPTPAQAQAVEAVKVEERKGIFGR